MMSSCKAGTVFLPRCFGQVRTTKKVGGLSARGAQQQLAESGGRKETRQGKNAGALAAHAEDYSRIGAGPQPSLGSRRQRAL